MYFNNVINDLLFVDYYELVNEIINNVSHKSNANSLAKLKKISKEKDEFFEAAKVNAQEAR